MNSLLISALILSIVGLISADTCSMTLTERVDCGDTHTTPTSCVAKGCCWEVTEDHTKPNCFHKKGGGPDPTTGPIIGGSKKVYVHMMPWFESKASNGGKWGIHWTMANKNPDQIVDGKQNVASHYHPLIGAYASGDSRVIDWQLGLMKMSGISGVMVDWPGTSGKLDYAGNLRNAEAIIAGTERHGLEFGIVYEDHNLDLAGIGDKIGQAKADMEYIKTHYFSKGNYVKINGAPVLLDFGPQTLMNNQWDQAFQTFNPKPTFLILADKQVSSAGNSAKGTFAWVWPDSVNGLRNRIYNHKQGVMMGVAYPGFNAFYSEGGWGDIPWKIPVGLDTFRQSLDLALQETDHVQVCTWNDYGEGTIIEPTQEFQYSYLTYIQQKLNVHHTQADLEALTKIYQGRLLYSNNATMSALLEKQHFDLVHKAL